MIKEIIEKYVDDYTGTILYESFPSLEKDLETFMNKQLTSLSQWLSNGEFYQNRINAHWYRHGASVGGITTSQLIERCKFECWAINKGYIKNHSIWHAANNPNEIINEDEFIEQYKKETK